MLHEGQLGAGAPFERGDLGPEDARHVGAGGGALHGEHDGLLLAVEQFGIGIRRYERADAFGVARGVRGIAYDEEAHGIEPVDVGVIDDAAVVVAEERVVAAAFIQRRDVVGHGAAHRARGIGAGDEEAAHVRDIEDAGAVSDGVVLFDDAPVLDGHRPSGEGDDARALALVQVEQWCLAQSRRRGGGHLAVQCSDASPVGVGLVRVVLRICPPRRQKVAMLALRRAEDVRLRRYVVKPDASSEALARRGSSTGSDRMRSKSSSAAMRQKRSMPQVRHRCTMTCSPLRRVKAPIGAMRPPHSLARSPGVGPSTWRE